MDLEDEDQHICLSCHTLVTGLLNYINHRKNECPNRKANVTREKESSSGPENNSVILSENCSVSGSEQQNTVVNTQSSSRNHDDIALNISSSNQTPQVSNVTTPPSQQSQNFLSQGSTENIVATDSSVSLSMDINCPSTLAVNSALSPTTNRIVDPNIVLVEGEKHLSEFFTSLELQSRNSHFDGVKSQMLSESIDNKPSLDLENGGADFLGMNQSSADLDTTLRIANILNDLGFSSESEDEFTDCNYNVNFLDDSGDESHPPSNYTGGKWKPGTHPNSRPQTRSGGKKVDQAPPENHTHGKWKPGSSPQHHGGKWRRVSSPPPENHTHGKWKPGRGPPQCHQGGKWKPTSDMSDSDNDNENDLEEDADNTRAEESWEDLNVSPVVKFDEKCYETDSANKSKLGEIKAHKKLYCEVCDRTLLTEKSYEHHMQTKLHMNRCKEQEVRKTLPSVSESIECPICVRTFNNKYNFARHLVSDSHKRAAREQDRDLMLVEKYQILVSRLSPFQCQVCSFYCNNAADLYMHMLSPGHAVQVKTLTGPMLCVRCRYLAEENCDILKHMQTEEHSKIVMESKRPCVIKENRYKLRCKLCDKVFSAAKRLLSHMHNKHQIKLLNKTASRDCPHCGKHFQTIFSMSFHIRRVHMKERPFKCEQCGVAFSAKYTLKLHQKSKTHMDILIGNRPQGSAPKRGRAPLSYGKSKGGVFKCDHCNFKTKRYGDLRPHYLVAHANQMFKCDTCGTAYCFEKNLAAHMKSVSHKKAVRQAEEAGGKEVLSCMVCFQKFYNQKQLHLHELTHKVRESAMTQKGQFKVSQPKVTSRFKIFLDSLPKGYKKAACPECGKTVSRQNLLPHLRLHENDLLFECPMCGHKYTSMQSLRKHMKKHLGIKDYVCKFCGKEFYKASSYVVHMMRHDKSMPKSFKCDKCSSSFYRQWELSRHNKIHTSKNIKCQFAGCRLVFTNFSEYRTHERTHTGEKPYLCDECGYAGKTQQQLTRHRRTHTGERNFSCEYCPYKGSNSTHLRRHMRIHIGSKPYKCPYCEYRCNTHENIRKHITKTKKHKGLKIYPCKDCKFGTNDIKEYKEHMLTEHPNAVSSDGAIMSAFAGLYDNENDPRQVPEGSQALPVKERNSDKKLRRRRSKGIVVNQNLVNDVFKSSPDDQDISRTTQCSIVYEDHTYSTEDDIMRQILKSEEITVEVIHNPPQGWTGADILPAYSVPPHASEVIIDPSGYIPIRSHQKAEYAIPQPVAIPPPVIPQPSVPQPSVSQHSAHHQHTGQQYNIPSQQGASTPLGISHQTR